MSTLLKDLAPLLAKLIITSALTYMAFTGRLTGSLLAPLIEAIGHAFG